MHVALPGVQVLLIADVIFGAAAALVTVALTSGLLRGLWFALPLTRQTTDDED